MAHRCSPPRHLESAGARDLALRSSCHRLDDRCERRRGCRFDRRPGARAIAAVGGLRTAPGQGRDRRSHVRRHRVHGTRRPGRVGDLRRQAPHRLSGAAPTPRPRGGAQRSPEPGIDSPRTRPQTRRTDADFPRGTGGALRLAAAHPDRHSVPPGSARGLPVPAGMLFQRVLVAAFDQGGFHSPTSRCASAARIPTVTRRRNSWRTATCEYAWPLRAHAAALRESLTGLSGELDAIACDGRLTISERRAIVEALGAELDVSTTEGRTAQAQIAPSSLALPGPMAPLPATSALLQQVTRGLTSQLTFFRAPRTVVDVVGRKNSSSSSSSATSWADGFAGRSEAPLIDARLGAILQGRYSIRAQLATGAMGTVYRGERLGVGRPVAIKFLSPAIAAQSAFYEQFRNELRALSRVCHPNCVSMIDFGLEGTPYVVMELLGGVSLRQLLTGNAAAAPTAARASPGAPVARGAHARSHAGDRPPRRQAGEPAGEQ